LVLPLPLLGWHTFGCLKSALAFVLGHTFWFEIFYAKFPTKFVKWGNVLSFGRIHISCLLY
jgi:hypothetical protein